MKQMEPIVLLYLMEEISHMRYDQVWTKIDRQRVRDFWLNTLNRQQRMIVIQREELFLFSKMSEIQNGECDCSGCDNNRQDLKAEIQLLFTEYLDDLKSFSEQDKNGAVDLQLLLNIQTKCMKMIINVERKEMIADDSKENHRQEYYKQISSIFQFFAARMLDKRIIGAYEESIVIGRQIKLIQEEEDEKNKQLERKKRRSDHRKELANKKRLLKQQEQEKRLAEQREKEQEEAKQREEKERRSELKCQAKLEIKEKEKLLLEQKRLKSYNKLKKRKEQEAILKKNINSHHASSPSTVCSTTSTSSSSSSVTTKYDLYKPAIGYSILPDPFNYENNIHEWSFFAHSLQDQPIKDLSNQRIPSNKSFIWSNGWTASTSTSEDFHHHISQLVSKKSELYIVESAKRIYSVLDNISLAKYPKIPTYYTMSYLHSMMHELLNDDNITMDALYNAISSSDAFKCEKNDKNQVIVKLI